MGRTILAAQQCAWTELLTRSELMKVIDLAEQALTAYDEGGLSDAEIDSMNEACFEEFAKGRKDTQNEPQKPKPQRKDHLYIIRDLDFHALKVGRSFNPESRLKSLSTSAANRMELVKIYPSAGHLEEKVHNSLKGAGLHIRSEWFKDEPQTIELVDNFISA